MDDGRVWTADEFLLDLGLAGRTLRHWQQHGVVPPAARVDGQLVYTREHEYRVLGIARLQARGVRTLAEIATILDHMSRDELKRLVEGDVEAAAPEEAAAAPEEAESSPAAAAAPSAAATPACVEEHVDITLRPGLVLRVRRPIDEETRVLVGSIAALAGRSVEIR